VTLPFAMPALWCLLAAALFGASTPIAKGLLGDVGPVTLAGLFYAGAALATAPSALRAPWARGELPRLVGACVFGGVLGPAFVMLGLRMAPAGSVALWLNLEAPATALLGWAFFREHIGRRMWAAAGLTWLASVLLAGPSGSAGWLAGGLVTAGCLCWGLDNNLTAVISSYTPAQTTFVKGLVAAAANLAIGAIVEGVPSAGGSVLGALGVGMLSYGASIVLYVLGAQQLGATRAQMLFATAPFWGVVLAWLNEPVLVAQVAAGAIMAGGLALVYGERHAHTHAHESLRHSHWHRHDDGHHEHHDEPVRGWHAHAHEHAPVTHAHAHVPDLHHRHEH
jgi:drug/metabolite transporter (DMT)-like permease